MAIHIIDEANRCLNCKKPKCMEGCPVHTPVPHIIQLFKEHQVMDAGRELFENNPMSLICSIVCNHEMQCAGNCVLGKKGSPVHFSSIETYISDMYLDRMKVKTAEQKKQNVAVIGAGPAGMTVADRRDYTVRNSGVSASKNHSFQISEKTSGTGNQNTTQYSHWHNPDH